MPHIPRIYRTLPASPKTIGEIKIAMEKIDKWLYYIENWKNMPGKDGSLLEPSYGVDDLIGAYERKEQLQRALAKVSVDFILNSLNQD